jgi:phage shock protein A
LLTSYLETDLARALLCVFLTGHSGPAKERTTMNSFRRWTIGVCAKFDDLLGQVENHEALASQALRDMRTSLARANGQLARVERDCRSLEKEAQTCHATAERWRERAQKETDDKRALECLRRGREKLREAETLTTRLDEQRRMRDQVAATVRTLEQKFLDLSGKQRLLSTRQAAAQASEAVNAESGTSVEVEDVFGRWEDKLTEREFQPGVCHTVPDDFSEEYSTKEEEESLYAELRLLREVPEADDGSPNDDETNSGASS